MSFTRTVTIQSQILIIFALPLLILSCSDSGSNVVPQEVEQVVSPAADAGTINRDGNTFEANANGGYVFAYWSVISNSDTTFSEVKQLQASPRLHA